MIAKHSFDKIDMKYCVSAFQQLTEREHGSLVACLAEAHEQHRGAGPYGLHAAPRRVKEGGAQGGGRGRLLLKLIWLLVRQAGVLLPEQHEHQADQSQPDGHLEGTDVAVRVCAATGAKKYRV
jgi:hypothetical protein